MIKHAWTCRNEGLSCDDMIFSRSAQINTTFTRQEEKDTAYACVSLTGNGKYSLSEKISEAATSVDWKNSSGWMYPGRKMLMALSKTNSKYHQFQLISDQCNTYGSDDRTGSGQPTSPWPKTAACSHVVDKFKSVQVDCIVGGKCIEVNFLVRRTISWGCASQ
jgi:hypothetical protein